MVLINRILAILSIFSVCLVSAGLDGVEDLNGGSDALICAISAKNVDIVDHLLSLGVSPNCTDGRGYSAMMCAVEMIGSDAILRSLLRHGGDISYVAPDGNNLYLFASQNAICFNVNRNFAIVRFIKQMFRERGISKMPK